MALTGELLNDEPAIGSNPCSAFPNGSISQAEWLCLRTAGTDLETC